MSQARDGNRANRESEHASLREVEARARLLVDSVRDYAIFMLDRDGIVTTWSRGAERIKGYLADEVIGQHFSRFYPPEDVRKCDEELAAALARGRFEDEGWRVRKDGTRFWANVVITPVRDSKGELIGFAKVTRDLTERYAAEQARLRLAETMVARAEAESSLEWLTRLQKVTAALAAAKTPDEIARIIVHEGVEALRAASAAFVRPRGDYLETVASFGVSDEMLARFRTLSPDAKVPIALAFKRRAPEWVNSEAEFCERYTDVAGFRAAASCALPLMVGDRILGVVGYRFAGPHSFAEHERALIETFASQAAQALERTDLYAREVVARERLEALSKLAQELSSALTEEDVARVVVERGRLASNADMAVIYGLDESSQSFVLVGEHGCPPYMLEHIRTVGPDSGGPFYETLAARKDLWVESTREYTDCLAALANAPVEGPRARAFSSVPLVSEGKTVGLLAMGYFRERRFPPEEREFVRTFSRHCAEALQRARRLEAERTARTLAETAQASLETTLRSIGDAVIATDANGRVSIMNPMAEALTGWSEAAARGRPLHEVFVVVDEASREPLRPSFDEVFARGAVVGLANRAVLMHRDGKREVPIDESIAPIRGPSGRLDGIVLVFRDVTESKREESRRRFLEEATAALAESLDYEATLAQVAKLAVPRLADWCAVDILEPGRHPRPRRVAAAHVDPEKVALVRALRARSPRDEDVRAGVPNVLRTGRSELHPEIADAAFLDVAYAEEQARLARALQPRSVMIVPLAARGRTLGAMTYAWAESGSTYTKEDLAFAEELGRRCGLAIENARLYAAEQRARESADVANRAKDEFLATVSHELRTPLNAIMGWAKLLSSGRLDEERRARAIETIDRNAVAMAQLIEDLLDISRIITGKMRLEVQPVDLARVIEAAIESVKPAADAKEIAITSTLDRSAASTLMGDPTRLQQVVWNLLSNAVKFTDKGGRIDVVMRPCDSEIEISVTDSGKGIDPTFLPHVFDAFRQEDASNTRARGGLGLGLAITKQLVELHGGQIEAKSDGEGRGSRFVVRLPAHSGAPAVDERATSPRRVHVERSFERPEQLVGIRVLVVDDEEDARFLVRAVLEACGCRVSLATSAEAALEAIQAEPPDVLVSDIAMPREDGYDLIRKVRSLPPERGGNVPAAAITAYARAEDRRRALDAGYSMHIPKPIEPAELVAVVASLLRFGKR